MRLSVATMQHTKGGEPKTGSVICESQDAEGEMFDEPFGKMIVPAACLAVRNPGVPKHAHLYVAVRITDSSLFSRDRGFSENRRSR